MADLVTAQLRSAAVTRLTGLSLTGVNVFKSRVYPLEDDELPCLLIATPSEENEYLTMDCPRRVRSRITLSVKALAKITNGLDDVLDAICKEVRSVLGSDPFLGGLSKDLMITGTKTGMSGEGEQPLGVASMLFMVEIHTRENAPDTPI